MKPIVLERFSEFRLTPRMLEVLHDYFVSFLRAKSFRRVPINLESMAGYRNGVGKGQEKQINSLIRRGLLTTCCGSGSKCRGVIWLTDKGKWVASNYWDLNGKERKD
jgi:hypothetical protein